MSIFDQLNNDIKQAMLNKDKNKLEALRAIKAAFLLAKTDASDSELTYDKEVSIIQKLIKQRNDAAEIYKSNNRLDLYEPEIFQANVMAGYLPEQMSEEDLKKNIQEIIIELNANSIKDMGKVMAMANTKLAGKTDSKTISTIVKSLLA